jgi:hypothetical protein
MKLRPGRIYGSFVFPVLMALLLAGGGSKLQAQSESCTYPLSLSSLRSEGATELLAPQTFNCSGPGGTTDITINMSLPITSKILNSASGITEAVEGADQGVPVRLMDLVY